MLTRTHYLATAVTALAIVVAGYYLYVSKKAPASEEVAIVNGVKISYADISAGPPMALPGEITEPNRADARRDDIRRLAGKIRSVIFERRAAEFGITASESEVGTRVEEIFQEGGITKEKAQEMCRAYQRLYEALAAWQTEPNQSEAIYNRKLAGSLITHQLWKAFQLSYDTPDKLEKLVIPKNIDDMKDNSRASAKKDVLHKKLEDFITKDVTVKSEEIRKAYEQEYASLEQRPPFEAVRNKLESQLLTRKKQQAIQLWWQQQYKQADIEIKDPRFKKFEDSLRSGERFVVP